jgi:hypothetical protein
LDLHPTDGNGDWWKIEISIDWVEHRFMNTSMLLMSTE